MKIIRTVLLFLMPIGLLQTTIAVEAPWFEIEILIFEQSNQDRLNAEKWQQQITLPNTLNSKDFLTVKPSKVALQQVCVQGNILPVLEVIPITEIITDPFAEDINSIDILNQDITTAATTIDKTPTDNTNSALIVESEQTVPEIFEEELPFIILDSELNQLNAVATSLRRRRGYRPLLHISWRQPVEAKKDSQLIRLFAGKNFSDTFNPEGDARVNIATLEPDQDFDNLNDAERQNNDQMADNLNQLENQQSSTIDQDSTPFTKSNSTYYSFQESDLLDIADNTTVIQQQLNDCESKLQQQAEQHHTDVWEVDGNVRIYVERYLHLETDMYLRIPGQEEIQLGALETSLAADKLLDTIDATETNNENSFGWQLGDDFLLEKQDDSLVTRDVLNKYALQQSRRLRSNETHYIDHPLFGLLIQIRPYEKPSPTDIEDSFTQQDGVND